MSNTSAPNVSKLFQQAQQEGVLSAAAVRVLDTGIQMDLGLPALDVPYSEVILLGILVDDSGSMRVGNNTQLAREGVNMELDAFLATREAHNILVDISYLNGHQLCSFNLIDQAPRLDRSNYPEPTGGTPLYDQTVEFLRRMIAKTLECEGNGMVVRTISLVITDGHDEHSKHCRSADVAAVVRDMRARENQHIVSAMGISDGHTDFKMVFAEMGLDPSLVLTPGNTPHEIRAAFQMHSRSSARASKSAGAFSNTIAKGFGA